MIKSSFTESLKKELMQREDSTHLQVNDSFNLNMHELVPGDKDEDLQFTLLKINSNKKQNNIGKVYAYGNLTPIQEIENSDLKQSYFVKEKDERMTHVRKNLIHKLNGDKENYSDNQGLVKNVTKVEISKGLGLDLNARILL